MAERAFVGIGTQNIVGVICLKRTLGDMQFTVGNLDSPGRKISEGLLDSVANRTVLVREGTGLLEGIWELSGLGFSHTFKKSVCPARQEPWALENRTRLSEGLCCSQMRGWEIVSFFLYFASKLYGQLAMCSSFLLCKSVLLLFCDMLIASGKA